ncbi:terminase large subunit domain-containing protein, partial [Escherichia coli]|uniref:terminase large subunit domain-containing protein n=1 Tax=Escherichia coli TaxID=562 RepID=UPI001EDB0172
MKSVQKSYPLRKNVHIQKSFNTMTFRDSVFKALSGDSSHDGLNIHFACYDEYHLEKNRELYDVLISGMGARRQPLLSIITT